VKKRSSVTIEKEKIFLKELSQCGNVTQSAAAAGIGRRSVYRARKRSETFAKQWDEAEQLGVEALLDEARRRAVQGTVTDWMTDKDGNRVPAKIRYSDNLLMFLIKARKPEYRDRQQIDVGVTAGLSKLAERMAAAERRVGHAKLRAVG